MHSLWTPGMSARTRYCDSRSMKSTGMERVHPALPTTKGSRPGVPWPVGTVLRPMAGSPRPPMGPAMRLEEGSNGTW